MEPWTGERIYLNFICDESEERVRSAFDPDRYDPAEPEHRAIEQERHGVLENGPYELESTRILALPLEIHSLPERVAVSL
ncbi:MAG: hypothetical protein ACR2JR_05805 [Rubrobacteraceae bacterium]